jgi:hypothetical protein
MLYRREYYKTCKLTKYSALSKYLHVREDTLMKEGLHGFENRLLFGLEFEKDDETPFLKA